MRLKKDGSNAINSKKKGNLFELIVAKRLAEVFDIPFGTGVRRTPGSGSLTTRSDIFIHIKYRAKFNFFMELKKHQTIKFEHFHLDNCNLVKWFYESKAKISVDPDYALDTPGMLIFSRNSWPIYCMVEDILDDKHSKQKFSFMLTLPKKKLYCFLFEEYLAVYKELQEFYDRQLASK